jgi:hypothetical protein
MRRVAPLLLVLAGCDFFQSATAKVVVSGIVAKSPAIELDGQYAIPGETLATVWLGERESETSTGDPDPITGADVSLLFDGKRIALEEQNERGLYLASSLDESRLFYSSIEYGFVANIGEDSADFGGAVAAPTELTAAAMQLSPSPTESVPGFPEVKRHAKNAALSVRWQPQFGRYGYVSVFRASNDPAKPTLVFDNRPQTALEWIELVAGAAPESIMIPADAFAQDGVYAIVLVAMEKGDVLPSTFIGSPELAGSGTVRFLAVGEVSL